MKISLIEPIGVPMTMINDFQSKLQELGHEFCYYPVKSKNAEEMASRCTDSDIVMIANTPFPAEVVNGAKNLKFLDVAFTGIDHVALDECRSRNILVCNASGYSNRAVSELVIGDVIALYRKLNEADAAVRACKNSSGLTGQEIAGKTVGIVGTGKIGIATAKLFSAFGANIIGYSRSVSKDALATGINYVSLDDLLAASDIVSLHVPSNASTRHLIGDEQLQKMKKSAILVNCARGPVVDNEALAARLNDDTIAGAAIDVFDMEPPLPEDYPLLHAKNLLLTPHVAFLTQESMISRADIVFRNVFAYLGGNPENVCK